MSLPPDDNSSSPGDLALAARLLPRLDGRMGPARPLPDARVWELAVRVIDRASIRRPLPIRPEIAKTPVRTLGRQAEIRRLFAIAAVWFALSLGVGAGAMVSRTRPGGPDEVTPTVNPTPPRLRHFEYSLPRSEPPPPPPPQEKERRPRVSRIAPAPAPAPLPQAQLEPEKAPLEDLLAYANERRRARDWSGADQLYRVVTRRFPESDAAVVARVASATLQLEQLGDAAGALRDYRGALSARPTGALAEEARWGIAMAERSLGRSGAEAQALRDFLSHHPDSAMAGAARNRQSELAR